MTHVELPHSNSRSERRMHETVRVLPVCCGVSRSTRAHQCVHTDVMCVHTRRRSRSSEQWPALASLHVWHRNSSNNSHEPERTRHAVLYTKRVRGWRSVVLVVAWILKRLASDHGGDHAEGFVAPEDLEQLQPHEHGYEDQPRTRLSAFQMGHRGLRPVTRNDVLACSEHGRGHHARREDVQA